MKKTRRAKIEEAQTLSDLAMRSKATHNYPSEYLERCRSALTLSEQEIENWPVLVIEENHSVVGFFALMKLEGENRLEHLWLEPAYIGKGLGSFAFSEIILEAKKMGWESFRIVADPKARGFYEKMGALLIGTTQSKISKDIFLPFMEYTIQDD